MDAYAGRENLEVMTKARNYNRFLAGTVSSGVDLTERVLDFGAGLGDFAVPLQERGFDVTCVEPDRNLGERLRGKGLRVEDDVARIPECSVDYVYTLNVLEHIEDDGLALAQIFRCLKPGGRLLIYVPAFPLLYTSMDEKVGHYRRYLRRGIVALLERSGFRVERSRYVDSIGFFATLLFKVLDNGSGRVEEGPLVLYDRLVFPLSRCLDFLCWPFFGKNVLVRARRPR